MSSADVEQIALKLSENERAHLASILLSSADSDVLNHPSDEFERREHELEQVQVSEISHEELLKRVAAERRL